MGGSRSAPDNSAQIEAAQTQQADLAQKNKELQMKKEAIATKATADFNTKRRGQSGRSTLIATSEKGVLGTTGKLGN
jgi:hypothetical protein